MKANYSTVAKYATLGFSILLISACANRQAEEGTIGAWSGYQEQKLSDTSYQLSYTGRDATGNKLEAWKQIEGLWHQRARELCGNDQYRSSGMERATPCRTHYAVYGAYLRREKQCLMELTGQVDCQ